MITYSATITLVKISVLLLYRRIFSTPGFRRTTLIMGVACVLWFIAEIISNIFACHPVSAFWQPQLLFTDHCFNLRLWYYGITISNMVLDISILCLPLYVIHTLRLSANEKLLVSGLFLLGSL